jgi:adenine-specific DNA-methyltransferase
METTTVLPKPAEATTVDYGEVFTRRWVAELILDLCGYVPERDLAQMVAVEPSCGSGAFLLPMIDRLVASARLHDHRLKDAIEAIDATDLLQFNVRASRKAVRETLTGAGLSDKTAAAIATAWVKLGDFVLDPPAAETADFVVGNPPYIRMESIPAALSKAYRDACPTMGGRADIYIGFYEHGLLALKPGGTLGFICADRWMRNSYGSRLRAMVASAWSMDAIVSMTEVDAFEEEVDAYPAITVLRRGTQRSGPLVVDASPGFGPDGARELATHEDIDGGTAQWKGHGYRATRLPSWFSGQCGWPHGSPDTLAAIADIETRLPTLENLTSGTKVGIGVATGADRVFIVSDPELIERERLLPLALPRDLASGQVVWSGHYLVNPWDVEGLIDLDRWPQTARYLCGHRAHLARRHTARTGKWHKTIDRVIEGLVDSPKLYMPDFGEVVSPVLDDGSTYPHHNLYWITSDKWDLSVLGGLLMSDVANMFVAAYSVRMRGGYLRFQAQYLRRIRVPHPEDIDKHTAAELASAFSHRDRARATKASLPLYGLTHMPRSQ